MPVAVASSRGQFYTGLRKTTEVNKRNPTFGLSDPRNGEFQKPWFVGSQGFCDLFEPLFLSASTLNPRFEVWASNLSLCLLLLSLGGA